jgi:hypothetical protein
MDTETRANINLYSAMYLQFLDLHFYKRLSHHSILFTHFREELNSSNSVGLGSSPQPEGEQLGQTKMSATTGAASAPDDFTNFQNGHNDQDPATPTPGKPMKLLKFHS